jgi:hypothetical protein
LAEGPGCFDGAALRVRLALDAGVTVPSGSVVVRSGTNAVLESDAMGDDIVGVPHLELYATDPLDRDTDGDGLFDGAELALGANPNDPLDASKFRDSDIDGLANIVEDEGWFVGYLDQTAPDDPLRCRIADGSFIPVLDEFAPPAECVIVTSDRFEPDTDFDGLPDLLEHLIRSNPRDPDTDGDGLLDLDEFDPASPFSVDIGVYREFERRCADADRCSFTPVEAPHGTSVVLADTDFDGRDDRAELFDFWVISPCIAGEQLPVEVFSSPLSPDADHDGVLDGLEEAQGTDPTDPDTDDDGLVDNPLVDPQPDGCGKVVTFKFVDYRTVDDCDGAGGDGEFRFRFSITTPRGNFSFSQNNDDLDDNRTHTFASNQATFLLRPGESFGVSGHVWEDDSTSGDEDWYFSRSYRYETLPDGPTIIGPQPGEADDACFDGHQLQVDITSTGA